MEKHHHQDLEKMLLHFHWTLIVLVILWFNPEDGWCAGPPPWVSNLFHISVFLSASYIVEDYHVFMCLIFFLPRFLLTQHCGRKRTKNVFPWIAGGVIQPSNGNSDPWWRLPIRCLVTILIRGGVYQSAVDNYYSGMFTNPLLTITVPGCLPIRYGQLLFRDVYQSAIDNYYSGMFTNPLLTITIPGCLPIRYWQLLFRDVYQSAIDNYYSGMFTNPLVTITIPGCLPIR